MDHEDYRVSAYKKNQPLVHKPVFEKVNSQVEQILENKKKDQEVLRQAEQAAKTGTWFEKKKAATSEDVKEATKVLTSGGLIKVPDAQHEGQEDSLYRRVAKFLVVIGTDESAKILPHLTEEQIEKIIPEIASIQKVSPEEAEQVLQEFQALLEKSREDGGLDTARSILTKAYGSEKAEQLIEKSVPYAQGKPFDYLTDANSERIKLLIDGESGAVQALVLSQLEPKKAAAVISAMDDKQKKDVVLRLAKMKPVAPEVMANIDKALHDKMLTQNTENSQNLDGRGVLAQILKRMDPLMEQSIIKNLSSQDPELGADLRERLFTEEDVLESDDRYLQKVLHDMTDTDVAILIAGKDDAFRTKLLSNVSKTRGDVILEEEQLQFPIRKSDSERLTSEFYAKLRRAWEDGDLYIKSRDNGEVYV